MCDLRIHKIMKECVHVPSPYTLLNTKIFTPTGASPDTCNPQISRRANSPPKTNYTLDHILHISEELWRLQLFTAANTHHSAQLAILHTNRTRGPITSSASHSRGSNHT